MEFYLMVPVGPSTWHVIPEFDRFGVWPQSFTPARPLCHPLLGLYDEGYHTQEHLIYDVSPLLQQPQMITNFHTGLHRTTPRHTISHLQMPAMSPTMTEGGIASWKKKEGERFVAGDVLLEIVSGHVM